MTLEILIIRNIVTWDNDVSWLIIKKSWSHNFLGQVHRSTRFYTNENYARDVRSQELMHNYGYKRLPEKKPWKCEKTYILNHAVGMDLWTPFS